MAFFTERAFRMMRRDAAAACWEAQAGTFEPHGDKTVHPLVVLPPKSSR